MRSGTDTRIQSCVAVAFALFSAEKLAYAQVEAPAVTTPRPPVERRVARPATIIVGGLLTSAGFAGGIGGSLLLLGAFSRSPGWFGTFAAGAAGGALGAGIGMLGTDAIFGLHAHGWGSFVGPMIVGTLTVLGLATANGDLNKLANIVLPEVLLIVPITIIANELVASYYYQFPRESLDQSEATITRPRTRASLTPRFQRSLTVTIASPVTGPTVSLLGSF